MFLPIVVGLCWFVCGLDTRGQNALVAADSAIRVAPWKAMFTSGIAVGSEEFIRRLVGSEDEAFPTGHKTPPVNFTVGEKKLKTLRNLCVLCEK